jgi:hypothetical protein
MVRPEPPTERLDLRGEQLKSLKRGVGIDLTQCLSCAKCGRAVQVRTIEGVAENQKSESPGSYPGCGRTVLRPLRVLTRSPKLGGAFALAPPECVGMR